MEVVWHKAHNKLQRRATHGMKRYARNTHTTNMTIAWLKTRNVLLAAKVRFARARKNMAGSSSSSVTMKITLSILELDGSARELIIPDFDYYTGDLVKRDVARAFGIPLAEVELIVIGDEAPISGRKSVADLGLYDGCVLQLVRVNTASSSSSSDADDSWPWRCVSCGSRMARHIWEVVHACRKCCVAQSRELDYFRRE